MFQCIVLQILAKSEGPAATGIIFLFVLIEVKEAVVVMAYFTCACDEECA